MRACYVRGPGLDTFHTLANVVKITPCAKYIYPDFEEKETEQKEAG